MDGIFPDMTEGRRFEINGATRFFTYAGGASGRDVALVTSSGIGGVDVLTAAPASLFTGEVVASLGTYRVRSSAGSPMANALVRAQVTPGCGTFAGGTGSIDLHSDAQGIVRVPAFTALAFDQRCLFTVRGLPEGAGAGAAMPVYDPETVRVVFRDPYWTVAPGTSIRLISGAIAGGTRGLAVGSGQAEGGLDGVGVDLPLSWEVVSIEGGASALLSSDDNAVIAQGNASAGTYEVRARTANGAVGVARVTQTTTARPRLFATAQPNFGLRILDGGANCAFDPSALEASAPAPFPAGWLPMTPFVRARISGCATDDVNFRMSWGGSGDFDPNAVLMRYGPTAGDPTPRWRQVELRKATTYTYEVDFTLRDAVDDDDMARDGAISVVFAWARADRNLQGMWWSGAVENGWGMSVVQHRDTLFSVIYAYDDAGKPIWYVMPGGTWNAAHTVYSGALYLPRGSPFFAYDVASLVPGQPVGTIKLDFGAPSMDYTINGVPGHKALQTQEIGYSGYYNPIRGDMWWGGDSQSGWGVSVITEGNEMFAVWYTYDAAGNPTWFVMPGGDWEGDARYFGTMFRTLGSPWLGKPYNPALLQPIPVGTFSLRFSGDYGRLEYSNEGRTGTLRLFRQPF